MNRQDLISKLAKMLNSIPKNASTYHTVDILFGYFERMVKTSYQDHTVLEFFNSLDKREDEDEEF